MVPHWLLPELLSLAGVSAGVNGLCAFECCDKIVESALLAGKSNCRPHFCHAYGTAVVSAQLAHPIEDKLFSCLRTRGAGARTDGTMISPGDLTPPVSTAAESHISCS